MPGVAQDAALGRGAEVTQGATLGRRARVVGTWAVVVGTAWALAWSVTAAVIVDAERGYVVFGSSGALLATVVTGLVAHRLLPGRARRVPAGPMAEATAEPTAGTTGAAVAR